MNAVARARHRGPLAPWIGVSAAALFVAIAWAVFGDAAVAAWDRETLAWMRSHVPATWQQLLAGVSQWHRPRVIVAASAVALAILLWRRERAYALWLLCVVGGGAALNDGVKHALRRPRPGDEGAWVAVTDFSFPSGHVANATLLYGALALLLAARMRSRTMRAAVGLAASLAVAAVAVSRLALGAHYPSDVVAGAVLAVGWLALCVVALQHWQGRAADG